jgi:hypothetical protein
MIPRQLALVAAVALPLLTQCTAYAERVRFCFPEAAICAGTVNAPGVAGGAAGERIGPFGRVRGPVTCRLRPTHVVAYRHPFSGRTVNVSLALPDSTPRVEHRGRRVVYNYGSYTVEVEFLADGGVATYYDSGPGRPLGWCDGP